MKISNANIYIVTAPSGTGKTSLVCRLIMEVDKLMVSVSYTTRPMRQGDVDGEDYHFVDKATFEQMIENDEFLEYANVFGHYYGSSVLVIESCINAGNDVILEIDWQGAEQARQRLKGTVSIFILPPSREILLQRLRGRGTDSEAVIAQRTEEAVEEMCHFHTADFLLVNDDFEQTLLEFKAIVVGQRATTNRRRVAYADLITSLLQGGGENA